VLGCKINARLGASVCCHDACSLSCVTVRANLINGSTNLVVDISSWFQTTRLTILHTRLKDRASCDVIERDHGCKWYDESALCASMMIVWSAGVVR
jgi:hypothetical protein